MNEIASQTVAREQAILAWHGVHESGHLARYDASDVRTFDGPLVRVGLVLHAPGTPIPCVQGLHGSMRAVDMLRYTPGGTITRTAHWGQVVREADKLASAYREVRGLLPSPVALPLIVGWAAWCVQECWTALRAAAGEPDPRSVAAIDVVLRWCRGEASREEVVAAYAAAMAAQAAAHAALAPAASNVHATLAAAYAAAAAARVARAAASAAAAAAEAYAAYVAAHAAEAASLAAAHATTADPAARAGVYDRYAAELDRRLLAALDGEAHDG